MNDRILIADADVRLSYMNAGDTINHVTDGG